jgi:hypothetical protein
MKTGITKQNQFYPRTQTGRKANKKIQQIRVDVERHFYLVQAKLGVATPSTVKESYITPVNGYDQLKSTDD